jgi:hypothetical protein
MVGLTRVAELSLIFDGTVFVQSVAVRALPHFTVAFCHIFSSAIPSVFHVL